MPERSLVSNPMELLSPITPISGNDHARVLDVIRTAEREHWFSGLRQAELEIRALQSALARWTWGDRLREWFTASISPARRDALYQLALYESEYRRILAEHPEAQGLSYEALQHRYSGEALNARKAVCVAAAMVQRQFGLDPAAAQLLVTAAPEDLPEIAARCVQLSHDSSRALTASVARGDADYAAALLSSLPPEQREQAITYALQSGE